MCGASPAALGASLARAAPQNGPGARRASTAGLDGSGPSAALDTVTNTSRAATPSRAARMDRVLGTSPLYARSPSSKGERTPQVRPRAAMSTADPAATILLVEDDAPTRTFLADNLTADGYELLVADCARDGLRLLETKFPDVALVDLGLPDGSGLEIVRRVRASDGVASRIDPAVPLVVLSGRAGELDRLRGFERGCDDYVCKPIAWVVARRASRRTAERSAIAASTASARAVATIAITSPSSWTVKCSQIWRTRRRSWSMCRASAMYCAMASCTSARLLSIASSISASLASRPAAWRSACSRWARAASSSWSSWALSRS